MYGQLEIDIGNTRLKWRLHSAAGLYQGVLDNSDIGLLPGVLSQYPMPLRVAVSCVAKADLLAAVEDMASVWGASLLLAVTRKKQCGVTCGYLEPRQMGVDRWLAVIAAYNMVRQACVVVDAGSAITIDLVDDAGLHLGGYIVPGFYKMRQCLYQQTSRVKVAELVSPSPAALNAGVNTAEAVSHGLYGMVEGLLRRARQQLAVVQPPVIITGGDAAVIRQLGVSGVIKEDLVLDGLALSVAGQSEEA